MTNKPTILIVGASRGLGLALVEQFCSRDWHVIGTVRGKSAALDDLKARFPASLEEQTTDIADEASVRALHQRLNGRTLDCREDRLHGTDAASMGWQGRARQRAQAWPDHGHGRPAQDPGAREPRAPSGQRDPA